MKLEYKIKENNQYYNIKEVLKKEFHISDRLIAKLKNAKQIYLNNKPAYVSERLEVGNSIVVDLDFNEISDNIIPTKINLDILYEDEALLIVNKPCNMPVHPSMEHYTDSLSNGIKYYFESIHLNRKIRPVNRLDKDTTGIVIFAKNQYVQESLIRQMKNNNFKKEYLALVEGKLENASGIINAPIARKKNSIIERQISSNGVTSITHYTLIKKFSNYSLVQFVLETGRTHQIRVHCKYMGHPILGDTLYGNSSELINRQALHAYKINFIHPIINEEMEIVAELPADIRKLI